MADEPQGVRDPEDLPALYQAANRSSVDAQNRFLLAMKIRLGGLLVAAIGGAVSWRHGDFAIGGLVALVAFLAAIGAELYAAVSRPERVWYEARAAAESAKTLAWRYMVRGESFEGPITDESDSLFVYELKEILQDLKEVDELAAAPNAVQITDAMRALRGGEFEVRRSAYLHGRILNQQGWYSRKARWNSRRARRWLVAGIVAEFCGVMGAALTAFGEVDVDLLGILAAVAATITAWVQAKQHQNLATAYGVTAQELAAVATEWESAKSESDWPVFVGQAEEAISREHTLWRASRGLGGRRPRRGSA